MPAVRNARPTATARRWGATGRRASQARGTRMTAARSASQAQVAPEKVTAARVMRGVGER